jgi:dephospho-CoA kinase
LPKIKRLNIAVTGGIGSGKSSIIKELQTYFRYTEVPVNFISVDDIVKQAYNYDEAFKSWLVENFGTSLKSEVSKLAFQNENVRLKLESRLMAYVCLEIGSALVQKGINILEVPLLFQFDLHTKFDQVIHIVADDKIRANRATKRDNVSYNKVYAIMKTQEIADLDAKKMQCDSYFKIDTSNIDVDQGANAAYESIVGLYMSELRKKIFQEQ